jgi:hypothetical protein
MPGSLIPGLRTCVQLPPLFVSQRNVAARTIAHDFAHLIPASQRRTLLGIAQLIMHGELAVNRVMDNLDVPQ